MHELSIALSILDVAEEEGRKWGGHVSAVHVKIGPMSGVVAEALVLAFELARQGTALAQAELVIEETPLVVHCSTCGVDQTLDAPYPLCCPACGAWTNEIVSGRELEVHALEIEP